MHPEVKSDKPGKCPKCGMDLMEEGKAETHHEKKDGSYTPLFIIIGLITLVSLLSALNSQMSGVETFMRYFMAGFFLVFSAFKLIDLKGFANGYSQYDLLAKRVYGYGYVYPFLELALGLAYLTDFQPFYTNLATFILMTFSGIGVLLKVMKKEKFQCACLGTFLKVPLTKITLIEDFGMAVMALYMLFMLAK